MRENPPRMKNHRKSLPEILLKKLPKWHENENTPVWKKSTKDSLRSLSQAKRHGKHFWVISHSREETQVASKTTPAELEQALHDLEKESNDKTYKDGFPEL